MKLVLAIILLIVGLALACAEALSGAYAACYAVLSVIDLSRGSPTASAEFLSHIIALVSSAVGLGAGALLIYLAGKLDPRKTSQAVRGD